jgi:hypothetical protein
MLPSTPSAASSLRFAKPLRPASVAHDARMRSYCWQHVRLVSPVDHPWVLRCTDILTPVVVGVRADAMDRDNASREVSTRVSVDFGGLDTEYK